MSNNHLEAVLLSIFLYIVLGLSYFGWGKVYMSIIKLSYRDQEQPPATLIIWIGWAFTLFIFQIIHFAFPLNFISVSPIFFLGIALSVFYFTRQYRGQIKTLRSRNSALNHAVVLSVLSVLFIILSSWLASRAMSPKVLYDSGLYHFNSVRWINSFPIVPGLGNLHGRLAFNQSFFSYVAALNLYPLFGHGRSIANSFLWLLSFLSVLDAMLPILKNKRLTEKRSTLFWAPALFCIPILAYWALSSNGIQSPSPNLTSSLLQIVMFIIFCRVIATFTDHATISLGDSIFLILVGVTAITVKLSNLAFCGVIMILTFIASVKTSKKPILDSARLLIPPTLVMMVFCLRGLVLSGAPLYPSTLGYVNSEWSVPVENVIDEANWVYSWARQQNIHWSKVLGNWNWFARWFSRLIRNVTDIVYPVGLFLILSLINIPVIVFLKSGSRKSLFEHLILLLPILTGLVFWFATAPDPRFANALFLLLPIPALMLLVVNVQKQLNSKKFIAFICATLLVGNFSILYWALQHRWTLLQISLNGYQIVNQVPLNEEFTKSGLLVYTPVEGDQCWDAPLPCTPYFNEDLGLITPNDMSSGFTVSRSGNK